MKIAVLILGILILFTVIFWANSESKSKIPTAEVKGRVFSLYLATSPTEQEVGLAKFDRIEDNQAMLFVFKTPAYYSFWMKNMKFPIDIIFIKGNTIIDIFENVPVVKSGELPVYTPKGKADKVLEMNSGLTKKYGIKVGDKVNLNL